MLASSSLAAVNFRAVAAMVAASVRVSPANLIHPVSHCLVAAHSVSPLTVAGRLNFPPPRISKPVDNFRHFGQFAS
jgi:hypothetical protein